MIERMQKEHVEQWIALRASGPTDVKQISANSLPSELADLRALAAALRLQVDLLNSGSSSLGIFVLFSCVYFAIYTRATIVLSLCACEPCGELREEGGFR